MAIYEKISLGIIDAMKKKEAQRLNVLRMLKSKIMAINARGDLPDDEITAIIKTYYKNLKDALDISISNHKNEAAQELQKELEIVSEFLPAQISEEETLKIVKKVIQETGALSSKEIGKVMGAVMRLGLNVDGKLVKEIAEKELNS